MDSIANTSGGHSTNHLQQPKSIKSLKKATSTRRQLGPRTLKNESSTFAATKTTMTSTPTTSTAQEDSLRRTINSPTVSASLRERTVIGQEAPTLASTTKNPLPQKVAAGEGEKRTPSTTKTRRHGRGGDQQSNRKSPHKNGGCAAPSSKVSAAELAECERSEGDGREDSPSTAAGDGEIEELSKLRCTSECTEAIAEREKRRKQRCSDYPGLAFGSSIFSSDTLMKFSIIRNELHNILKSQLKRAESEVTALNKRISLLEDDLDKSAKELNDASMELAEASNAIDDSERRKNFTSVMDTTSMIDENDISALENRLKAVQMLADDDIKYREIVDDFLQSLTGTTTTNSTSLCDQ